MILELDEDALAKLNDAFKKVYPTQFGLMTGLMTAHRDNPKQKITDIHDDWLSVHG